jgi:hypothetical protein
MIFTIKILLVIALLVFMWCFSGTDLIKSSEIRNLFLGILLCSIIGMFNSELLEVFVDREKARKNIRNGWKDIIPNKNEKYIRPGGYLGFFERILFFVLAYESKYEVIGFWLAFKVATKWNAWKNIVQVPESLPEERNNKDEIEWLTAKREFSGWVMMRFQLGIILNILIGVGTAILIKNIKG